MDVFLWRLSWHKLTVHNMAKGAAKRGRASVGRSLACWTTLLLSKELKMKVVLNHPIQSMYGVFTYIWLFFWYEVLVDIPYMDAMGMFRLMSSCTTWMGCLLQGIFQTSFFKHLLKMFEPTSPQQTTKKCCSCALLFELFGWQTAPPRLNIGQQHDLWG